MNKRIKKLAEQAKKYACEYVAECKYYGHYMDHNEYELRFEEKFTELIVQEMLVLTYNEESRYHDMERDTMASAMRIYRELVKEHFGVEE